MKKRDGALIALGIEGILLAYQKVIAQHPLDCTCKTCLSIEVSIPVTAGITLALNDCEC